MSNYEYKTTSMPEFVSTRFKRKKDHGAIIAEILGETINDQAALGWEFVSCSRFTTMNRNHIFSRKTESAYNVIVFRRLKEPMNSQARLRKPAENNEPRVQSPAPKAQQKPQQPQKVEQAAQKPKPQNTQAQRPQGQNSKPQQQSKSAANPASLGPAVDGE